MENNRNVDFWDSECSNSSFIIFCFKMGFNLLRKLIKMKKSEFIQKMIEIEEEKGDEATITLNYVQHLKQQKRLVEIGDVELD